MPDPILWRSLWIGRLAEFHSVIDARMRGWRVEANLPDLLPRTHARIVRMIEAVEAQRTSMDVLFSDITKGGPPQGVPTRPEGGDLAILTCYENLFRDWVWGEKESEAARWLVARAAPKPLGRVAVLGAGAGRLPVDIHHTLDPVETVALDVNPLPLLVAEKLVRGETMDLPEFPVAPNSDRDVAIQQHLECPVTVRDGFTFMIADALRAPFAPGSFDTVLTPWFIDAVNADVRQTAAAINRLLRPGGHWVNLGPLRFRATISASYCIEEVWEIVEQNDFHLMAREGDDVPYFDSPVSGSRRTETVFLFVARKTGEAQPLRVPDTVAPWVTDTSLPIPRTPGLMTLGRTSLFTAGAISLIDGARSMADIASELGRSMGNAAPANLLDQLRAFFAKLPPG